MSSSSSSPIEYFYQEEKAWVYWYKNRQYTEKAKFHISIKGEQDDVEKAIPIIIDILKKHGITIFKHVDTKKWSQIIAGQNAKTKTFCVYICEEDNRTPGEWAKIIKEIESALRKFEIPASETGSLADLQLTIPGVTQQFFYYREPHNVLKKYVPATHLRDAGFCLRESAFLRKNDFIQAIGSALNPTPIPEEKKEEEEKKEVKTEEKEKETKEEALDYSLAYKTLEAPYPLTQAENKVFEHLEFVYNFQCKRICFGDEKSRSDDDFFEEERKPTSTDFPHFKAHFQRILTPLLKEAARRLNSIMQTGIKLDHFSISPVIYHKFFKPLIEKMDPSELDSIEKLKKAAHTLNPDAIIDELVKSCFRVNNEKQITSELPAYVLPEKEINDLIDQQRTKRKGSILTLHPLNEAVKNVKAEINTVLKDLSKPKEEKKAPSTDGPSTVARESDKEKKPTVQPGEKKSVISAKDIDDLAQAIAKEEELSTKYHSNAISLSEANYYLAYAYFLNNDWVNANQYFSKFRNGYSNRLQENRLPLDQQYMLNYQHFLVLLKLPSTTTQELEKKLTILSNLQAELEHARKFKSVQAKIKSSNKPTTPTTASELREYHAKGFLIAKLNDYINIKEKEKDPQQNAFVTPSFFKKPFDWIKYQYDKDRGCDKKTKSEAAKKLKQCLEKGTSLSDPEREKYYRAYEEGSLGDLINQFRGKNFDMPSFRPRAYPIYPKRNTRK